MANQLKSKIPDPRDAKSPFGHAQRQVTVRRDRVRVMGSLLQAETVGPSAWLAMTLGIKQL